MYPITAVGNEISIFSQILHRVTPCIAAANDPHTVLGMEGNLILNNARDATDAMQSSVDLCHAMPCLISRFPP